METCEHELRYWDNISFDPFHLFPAVIIYSPSLKPDYEGGVDVLFLHVKWPKTKGGVGGGMGAYLSVPTCV